MATVESASESLARAAVARSATLAALVLEIRKDPEVYLLSSEWGMWGLFWRVATRGARRGGARRFLGRARGRRGRPRHCTPLQSRMEKRVGGVNLRLGKLYFS